MFVPTKLLLIVLVVFAVWYAMRWVNGPQRQPKVGRRRPAPAPPRQQEPRTVEDLVACGKCGAYVAPSARGCGRPGCPQPR